MHKTAILVTMPNHDDTTRYLSAWSKSVIKLAHQKKDKILIQKTISGLLTSESKTDQSSMMRFLIWDMKHQVCLGNKNAKI